jgi:transcriptional regulator with XRE-family HTH domain
MAWKDATSYTSHATKDKNMPESSLGRLLRQHRDRVGLTQRELAQHVKRAQPWISRVERGKTQPTAEEIRWLAAALSLDAVQTAEVIKLAGEPRPTMTANERRAVVERIEKYLAVVSLDLAKVSEELARLR